MVATVFVVLLSITGFLLLHTDALRLQDREVSDEWILDWYGMEPVEPPVSYPAGGRWVTQVDDQVYMDETALPGADGRLKGVLNTESVYVLAYENSLDLLTERGERIERLGNAQGLPQGIEQIGAGPQGRILLKTGSGVFVSDMNMGDWRLSDTGAVNWSVPADPPVEHLQLILQKYRGTGLPLERVVQDLHSGRFLGSIGVWLVDISVVIFLAMSFTGWWSWLKRRAMQKEIDGEN
jgi:hypothetical protein